MVEGEERRGIFRRFEDRRNALLLGMHEALFDGTPGEVRDVALLETLLENFAVSRAALLRVEVDGKGNFLALEACRPKIDGASFAGRFDGPGVRALVDIHGTSAGALTLTRFRRSSAFAQEAWDALWGAELVEPATALLSVELVAARAPRSIVWLVLENSSREWSSHDRALAEEAAKLWGRAADRAMG